MSALPDDDELQAAELAFGLIEGDERHAAEQRLDRDPDFAAAYDRWCAYGAAMFDGAGEMPRPSVWTAIAARLPANDIDTVSRSTLRWWQGGTAVAGIAAALLAVVALRPPPAPRPAPPAIAAPRPTAPLVAVLTGEKGLVTISYDSANGRITAAPNGVAIGDRSPELWVIPADGKPRSLGLISAGQPLWKAVPKPFGGLLTAGVTLAISVEPLGGSPTGQPTGPVIMTGKLTPA